MQGKENQALQNQDFDFATPVHIEFLQQNAHGDKQLLHGLEVMFKNYFKNHRHFDNANNCEAVLEAYHICCYIISKKAELFNSKNIA